MIAGNKVRLRAIEREDIPNFVRWLNDREVTQFLLTSSPYSKAMEEKWFEHQLETPTTHGQVLAIDTLVEGTWVHIGNCGLHNIEQVSRNAEFGIMIGEKEFWNRGLGTEATRLMLKHVFEDLNLHRIYLDVYATNPRAQKAYLTAGFVVEGTKREAVFKNGHYIDVILMSILQSEWKGF